MNVIVTGASGFLGRNLIIGAPSGWRILALYNADETFPGFVENLARPNLSVARCDLMSQGEVQELFRNHGCEWDACIFLAARVDIPWSVRQPLEDLLANTTPVVRLLEHLRAEKFVYFSSGAVYDGFIGEATPDTVVGPTLPYAISKLASERYVRFFKERRQAIGNYLIVRFFGAYGPYEAPRKIYTRLIRAFAFDRRESYTVYGDGRNLIDAMYVDDAVEAIRRMVEGTHWNRIVNLAAGHPQTIEALVREVGGILGNRSVRVDREGVANESNQFWGSTGEMQRLFNFTPQVKLAEGIDRLRKFLELERN